MSPEIVLKYFEVLSEAPDALGRFRKFLLDLAVRGKLVERDTQDEPASKLLERVMSNVRQFCRKEKKNSSVDAQTDPPFEIPDHWKWVRLGDVVRIRTGKLDANAAVSEAQYPFFTCSQSPSRIDRYSFDTAAVLLAGNGDFNVKYYEGRFDAYQRTYVIEPLGWDLKYCFILVASQRDRIVANNRGSAIPYLKLADITTPLGAISSFAGTAQNSR